MGLEKDPGSSCAFCRFMRSLAFSAVGAAIAGYGALALGADQKNAIIAAFVGSLAVVTMVNKRRR